MAETKYSVTVMTTVRGVESWRCSVTNEDSTLDEILEHSDRLVTELRRRYPTPEPDDPRLSK